MRFAAILFMIPAFAFAQGPTFPRDLSASWVNPDSFIDGTLMEPGDLTGVRLECFRLNDAAPVITANFPSVTGEGQPQSEVLTGAIQRPGTYTCYAYSIVIGGIESDPSDPASVKHVGKPNPPTILTVT